MACGLPASAAVGFRADFEGLGAAMVARIKAPKVVEEMILRSGKREIC